MKKFLLFIGMAACLSACCSSPKIDSSVPAKVKDGIITLETPARPAGQMDALQLTCDPIETIRVAFVGLGMRGPGAVKRWSYLDGIEIKAICDVEQSNLDKVQGMLTKYERPAADEYVGPEAYKELCERDDIDLVYIATDWIHHTPIAVYAMEHGKHVAIEVPSAMSIDECWQLVNTCEKTRKHCMMLENCVYDFFEITALNMAQHGLFGEIYHVEGAYIHNLEPFWHEYWQNWRLLYNQTHRGDNYPTHGIGPVCQALNIHRGDKMNYVVSMDTDAFNAKDVAIEMTGTEDIANGDHVVSLIRTEKGKQIEIHHNVYAARPYSRMYQLTGTKGYASKYPKGQLAVGDTIEETEEFASKEKYDSLMTAYKPAFVAEIEDMAKSVGGHGGMDFIMDYRLVYCLHNGLPLDQDVYDLAEWCCLTELSRLSIENNSMPVEVPDFTRGNWNKLNTVTFATKE